MDKLLLGTFYYIYKLLSSVAEYHINCLCTELSLLLCILSSWWFYVEALAINGYQGKMLNILWMYIYDLSIPWSPTCSWFIVTYPVETVVFLIYKIEFETI
jgi:hypothetical protein